MKTNLEKICRQCGGSHRNHSNPYCSLRCSIEYRLEYRASGCLEWTGCTDPDGYGIVRWKKTDYRVHRAIYELRNGKLQTTQYVCHSCDNPRCCLGAHHFVGSSRDNQMDASRKGRRPRGESQHRARLRESDVREIKRSAESARVLSVKYDTPVSNIRWIKSGRGWAHV